MSAADLAEREIGEPCPPTAQIPPAAISNATKAIKVVKEEKLTEQVGGGKTKETVVREVQAEDANTDGIPDKLQTFLHNSDFRLDWTRRRKLVYKVVVGMGVVYGLIVLALLYMVIFEKAMDENLAGLLSTLLWTQTVTFTTIFMAYIFGVTWDSSSFRGNITSMVSNFSSARTSIKE